VRKVTVDVLKAAGYVVLIAKNAAEAYRLYEQFSGEVDLLLSDVILPDDNGRTLACKLRSKNPQLSVLLVTGYAEQVEMMKAEPAGVECLPKPFSARTLLEKVRMIVDRKQKNAGWHPITHACGIE
jgi:two-component system, cell cycle sensor histidine kinase and response regulator CckA